MQLLLDHPEALEAWLKDHGQPSWRARQVRKWVLQGRATTFSQMTDLPLTARAWLAENAVFELS